MAAALANPADRAPPKAEPGPMWTMRQDASEDSRTVPEQARPPTFFTVR